MQILFYGNCQAQSLMYTMKKQTGIEFHHVTCFNTTISEQDFKDLLCRMDIVVTQYLAEGYRNMHHLSTLYVVDHCPGRIILIDSCYFDVYHFDIISDVYDVHGQVLDRDYFSYHYESMIRECWIQKTPLEEYLQNTVYNVDLHSVEYLEKRANFCLSQLEKRFHKAVETFRHHPRASFLSFLCMADFIREHYRHVLLFYCGYHLTKYLLQPWLECILLLCHLPTTLVDYSVDPQGYYRGILFHCVHKLVTFDTEEFPPLFLGESTVPKIFEKYINEYDKINFQFGKIIPAHPQLQCL